MTAVDEERITPVDVEALPLEARAAAYLEAQHRLEARLELPAA